MLITSIEDDIDGFVVGIFARLQDLVIRVPLPNLQRQFQTSILSPSGITPASRGVLADRQTPFPIVQSLKLI